MPTGTALLTDRYELTMVAAALADGTADRDCVFEVFARRLPHGRRYGVVAEPEGRQLLEQPAGAGEDAVAPAVRQPAGEHLEDAVPAGGAVGEGGGDHRQLVPVAEEGGTRRHGGSRGGPS